MVVAYGSQFGSRSDLRITSRKPGSPACSRLARWCSPLRVPRSVSDPAPRLLGWLLTLSALEDIRWNTQGLTSVDWE